MRGPPQARENDSMRWATALLVGLLAATAIAGEATAPPDTWGYTAVGKGYFPTPRGVEPLAVPNGSFEEVKEGGRPPGWAAGGFRPAEGHAPDGKRLVEAPADAPCTLVAQGLPARGGRAHLLSLWLRSTSAHRAMLYAEDAPGRFGRHNWRALPSTAGQWRRVGLYFHVPRGTTKLRFTLRVAKDAEHGPIAIDDVRLRTASREEMAMAYDGWRAQWPARDLAPRPTDGRNLALTVRKLEQGLDPDRPFRIWAIGSSYTNMLGLGEIPIAILRQRFPNAPDVVYKKHVGASVPFSYLLGWARHIVVPDQPDLVLVYTIGKPDDLDALLTELRAGCTADILVPTIHWRIRDIPNWGVSEDAVDQDVSAVREVCARQGVELVENRREWAEFLKAQGLKVEIDAEKNLLKDAVHQSDYGKLIINENIARHFARPERFAYNPDERERRLGPARCESIRANEKVEFGRQWRADGGALVTSAKGARVTVRFQGRRIDLVGARAPGGGTAKVLVDGRAADQIDAFFMSFIEVGKDNVRPKRGLVTDRAPHGVVLGRNVVPQTWTITMTDDGGHYTLEGSVTGFDGQGDNAQPFTSHSGQILVPPDLWRYNRDRQGKAVNKKGDTFTWRVYRTGVGTVDFKGEAGQRFRVPLIQNLPNAAHTLELVTEGGPVRLEAFDVFEPALR